jgi:ribonuclease P protein component
MKIKTIIKESEIKDLFEVCKTISNKLIMIKYLDSDETKFMFCVSSKRFKRAVDRNRIKRLMFETVRKLPFDIENKNIAVIYIGSYVPKYDEINQSINNLIVRI